MGGDGRVVDSVAVRAEVPVVSERHMEEVPVEVLEAAVVSAADRGAVPAGVLEVQAASEDGRVVAREKVPVALVEDMAVVREGVPVFAAYRTDNTENKAVVPASAEVLEASVEGLAYACGHRKYPA